MTLRHTIEARERAHENVPRLPELNVRQPPLAQEIFCALFPSRDPGSANYYRGRHDSIWRLLGKRVTLDGIKHLIAGHRQIPLWARRILHDELVARAHHYLALAERIAAVVDPPSRRAEPFKRWHAKRRKEAAERAKKEEGTTALPDRNETGETC